MLCHVTVFVRELPFTAFHVEHQHRLHRSTPTISRVGILTSVRERQSDVAMA